MSKNIYIFTIDQKIDILPGYLYQIIGLAQGLKEKGYNLYSNKNYWLEWPDFTFLINHNADITFQECDIVIIPCQYFSYGNILPKDFFNKSKKYITVLIDVCDGFIKDYNDKLNYPFDYILKHKYRNVNYVDERIKPWAYGLTNEIIEIIEKLPKSSFEDDITVNYRNNHGIRDIAEKKIFRNISSLKINRQTEPFLPDDTLIDLKKCKSKEDLLFYQSGFRHHINYLKRINKSKINACFGGEFFFSSIFDQGKKSYKLGSYFLKDRSSGRINNFLKKKHFQFSHTQNIYQWDSYRLWETWISNSVVLHCDFEKYGVIFPETPINGKDYIGVPLNNPKLAIEKIISGLENREEINKNGKTFAVKFYSPQATANRFIKTIK